MCIKSDDIEIRPLQNKEEFIEEGLAMHHCVATYWGKRNSFILSVRKNGKRLATIEIDMHDFSVKQCRAVCNEVPADYDRIISILNNNKSVFLSKPAID